jgi:hypothetical protein
MFHLGSLFHHLHKLHLHLVSFGNVCSYWTMWKVRCEQMQQFAKTYFIASSEGFRSLGCQRSDSRRHSYFIGNDTLYHVISRA